MVATGLGQRPGQSEIPLVEPRSEARDEAGESMRLVASAQPNYRDLDMPTVMRKQPVKEEPAIAPIEDDGNYLDIPAFLRRQAD